MNKKMVLKAGVGMAVAAATGFLAGKMDKTVHRSDQELAVFENREPDPENELIEGITKEIVMRYLKRLFSLLNTMDLREVFNEYDIPQEHLVHTCARITAKEIYDKLKTSFHIVPAINNTNEQGRDISGMDTELFIGTGACIYREQEEAFFGHINLVNSREIWLLPDQEGAFVEH